MGRRLQKRRSSNRNFELSARRQEEEEEPETGSTEDLSTNGFTPFRPPFADDHEGITELSRNGSFSTLGLPKSGFPSMDHLGRSDINLLKEQTSRSDITLTEERYKKKTGSEDADDSEEEDKDETEPVKRTWFQRLNPFDKGPLPPIPRDDAGLVPEITANWFSKLTWGWISPLMMVMRNFFTCTEYFCRRGIGDHCRRRIYGVTMSHG